MDQRSNTSESMELDRRTAAIQKYWNEHPLGTQYVTSPDIVPGSPEYFEHIRPWMNPYKFSWIMDRIDKEALLLKGKHLLEIGCGMGYDSLEFIRRGVRVTAVDLTPNAVEFMRQHMQAVGATAEGISVGNALDLPFEDNAFDAVWSNGVLHATGDTRKAISEVFRVLKPGGRAIISHFYRKPSWMYVLNRFGRENIEFKDEDPPVNKFYTEAEIESMFEDFEIRETFREHHRALPVARSGLKAALYKYVFRPLYNLIPESIAKRYAYKYSVIAVKPANASSKD